MYPTKEIISKNSSPKLDVQRKAGKSHCFLIQYHSYTKVSTRPFDAYFMANKHDFIIEGLELWALQQE